VWRVVCAVACAAAVTSCCCCPLYGHHLQRLGGCESHLLSQLPVWQMWRVCWLKTRAGSCHIEVGTTVRVLSWSLSFHFRADAATSKR
jgi:hypothetical protein